MGAVIYVAAIFHDKWEPVMAKKIAVLADDTCEMARSLYGEGYVPLHRPIFEGRERDYLVDCVDSNFVSSVGERVSEFEAMIAAYTGSRFAVATVNGTSALQVSAQIAGVGQGDEVLTQALTFVATCNAIVYSGASPVFIDVDLDTMGLSPEALCNYLENNAERSKLGVFNKLSGRRIAACIPMHTFGFPCRINEIADICEEWGLALIEDSAESLGSYVGTKHTGRFGLMAAYSFNGNKVITTGGGGMITTDDDDLAVRLKHITTTSKVPHAYEFVHDEVGYNYRMPNLNAALGCAQMERLDEILSVKAEVASKWATFFQKLDVEVVKGTPGNKPNHWLNAIVLNSRQERDDFLRLTNQNKVMTRPIWTLMSKLPMFKTCLSDCLQNSIWLEDRVVNIPSSVPSGALTKTS